MVGFAEELVDPEMKARFYECVRMFPVCVSGCVLL